VEKILEEASGNLNLVEGRNPGPWKHSRPTSPRFATGVETERLI
jgi:hypothetical protein